MRKEILLFFKLLFQSVNFIEQKKNHLKFIVHSLFSYEQQFKKFKKKFKRNLKNNLLKSMRNQKKKFDLKLKSKVKPKNTSILKKDLNKKKIDLNALKPDIQKMNTKIIIKKKPNINKKPN